MTVITRQRATEYCGFITRQCDRDRYLASLFASDELRPHLWAIYAFNAELARIRPLVSEPSLGEIRLQWWRDALDATFAGTAPDQPVMQALAWAIDQGDLPHHVLVAMVEARRFDLHDEAMATLLDLNTYLLDTAGAVIALGARVLAGPEAKAVEEVAADAGIAYGLAGILRSLPAHRAAGQCYLPADMLKRRDLSPEAVISGHTHIGWRVVIGELVHMAEERLARARKRGDRVPRAALPAFLHVSLADAYLKALRRSERNLLTRVAEVPQWRRQLRLMRKSTEEAF